MTVTANNGAAQSADADYISFIEGLYASVPNPEEFSDAETMLDELIRIYDSLHKFMDDKKR